MNKRTIFISSWFLLLSIFVLIWGSTLAAQDISVTAAVDRTVVGIQQPLTLTLSISGAQVNMPELPPLPDFTVTSGTNTSTSIQIVDGRMTTTQSFSYTLIPAKVGKLTIGALLVRIKGKDYKTDPIIIDVVQNPTPQQQGPQQEQGQLDLSRELFILPVVSKREAYPNEGIKISYQLYTRVDIADYGISKVPGTNGFWVEEYPMDRQPQVTQKSYEGRAFQVATIKEMVVFPTRPGELTIQPLVLDANVRVRMRSSNDIFDNFFDDAFLGRTIRKTISSGPIAITVKQLPNENKPAAFTNAIGTFQLKASIDKKDAAVNEAIAFTVEISGSGNIKLLDEPKLEISGDMEQYAPKINTTITRGQQGISGSKTFEYVLIPRIPGTKRMAPLTFCYFDPEKKVYVTKSTPELVIEVTKGKAMATTISSNLSREEVKLLGQDVRFLKVGNPYWIAGEVMLLGTLREVFLLVVPFVMVGAAVFYRRRLDKLSGDRGYARSVRAFSNVQKRLKSSEASLTRGQKEVFISLLADALHGFIADKLNLDAAGLISDEVMELLQKRSVRPETIDELKMCMESCDYSRFAPSSVDESDLKKMLEKTRTLITDLEKELKSNGRK